MGKYDLKVASCGVICTSLFFEVGSQLHCHVVVSPVSSVASLLLKPRVPHVELVEAVAEA